MSFDVIVIGGGPAGLIAAINSAQNGANTLLLEKNAQVGRKLRLTGGGRCNVTNSADIETIISNIPRNGRFLYSALSQFSNRDIIAFFEKEVPLKEEDNGRMFPVTDRASDIISVLLKKADQLGVPIRTESPVKNITINTVNLLSGESLKTKAIVIATGGQSFPHTGSTGDAYKWLTDLDHTVTELYPAEAGILTSSTNDLKGVSLRDISIEIMNSKNKRITKHQGDIIFTHYGLSGPAALRCSSHLHLALKKYKLNSLNLIIDLFPEKTIEELRKLIFTQTEKEPNKAIKTILGYFMPKRLIPHVLKQAELLEDTTFPQISKKNWINLTTALKGLKIPAYGTRPLKEAFVTGGGVSVKEIDPKTMQSKIIPGLFLAGEILDISGYTGGFNITAAMSTGFVAGKHAAAYANSPSLR